MGPNAHCAQTGYILYNNTPLDSYDYITLKGRYNGILGIPQSHDYCNDITAFSLVLDSTLSEQCSSLQNKPSIRPYPMGCLSLEQFSTSVEGVKYKFESIG